MNRLAKLVAAPLAALVLLTGCYNRLDLPEGSYRSDRRTECKPGFKKIKFGTKPKSFYCVPKDER